MTREDDEGTPGAFVGELLAPGKGPLARLPVEAEMGKLAAELDTRLAIWDDRAQEMSTVCQRRDETPTLSVSLADRPAAALSVLCRLRKLVEVGEAPEKVDPVETAGDHATAARHAWW